MNVCARWHIHSYFRWAVFCCPLWPPTSSRLRGDAWSVMDTEESKPFQLKCLGLSTHNFCSSFFHLGFHKFGNLIQAYLPSIWIIRIALSWVSFQLERRQAGSLSPQSWTICFWFFCTYNSTCHEPIAFLWQILMYIRLSASSSPSEMTGKSNFCHWKKHLSYARIAQIKWQVQSYFWRFV